MRSITPLMLVAAAVVALTGFAGLAHAKRSTGDELNAPSARVVATAGDVSASPAGWIRPAG